MSNNYLNLARKWRSKHFDEIVGQELAIRLIKNGLYRNLIFPVYLLSGQRGTGKTSTARIFAAALNCEKLETFQKEPKSVQLPCLECVSCNAMQKLAHPDFIEIDAASNTGVDNVRQIIDAASFVPVMGKKKIYLIDEAHMLSKAAFNALLKILEEPPKSAMFFLATTDSSKILETVKSRCFQLFFNPIAVDILADHLSYICKQEDIPFDLEGLKCIAMQTDGSARDALNVVERIRLAHDNINKMTVYKTLGLIDDKTLCKLFDVVLKGDEKKLLEFCLSSNLNQFDPVIVFKRFVDLMRFAVWIKLGVQADISEQIKQFLTPLIVPFGFRLLVDMLDLSYSYESMFAKTAKPGDVLELLLIKLCMGSKSEDIKKSDTGVTPVKLELKKDQYRDSSIETGNKKNDKWQSFLSEVAKLEDPLIVSIFRQANVVGLVEGQKKIDIIFNKDLSFYNDILQSTALMWRPIFKNIFIDCELVIKFEGAESGQFKKKVDMVVKSFSGPPVVSRSGASKATSKEQKIQITNVEQWTKANIITKVFPGVISCIASDKTEGEIQ